VSSFNLTTRRAILVPTPWHFLAVKQSTASGSEILPGFGQQGASFWAMLDVTGLDATRVMAGIAWMATAQCMTSTTCRL
jgi:hypothetical protein